MISALSSMTSPRPSEVRSACDERRSRGRHYGSGSPQAQLDSDPAVLAAHVDAAAVHLDQAPYDVQPHAHALCVAGGAGLCLGERLEEPSGGSGVQGAALVADGDPDAPGVTAAGHD